ncbi:MAG: TetR/AcrR family transcriptional regulator [Desulfobacterales bacterium]|nr:TetR/AcrR family transcriptional regulator [Desulfobacterales bacterium]
MTDPEHRKVKAEEIIQVASHLFSTRGYDATSLKDIADEVGLHKTSLFHYFKNKEEILMGIMDQSLNEHLTILDEIVNDPRLTGMEKLKYALEKQVLVTCKYKDHINVYLSEIRSLSSENQKKYKSKRKDYEGYFDKIIREIQADEGTDLFKGLNPRLVRFGLLGMCNWVIKWYSDTGPMKAQDIADDFYRMVTKK